ncbi:Uncharacterised protein [Klebsiella michiganensis]|nr:Uncharacterised protein [Klebsiella michiganensis]
MRDILDQDQRLVILRSLIECGDSAQRVDSARRACRLMAIAFPAIPCARIWRGLREQGLVSLTDVPAVMWLKSPVAVMTSPAVWLRFRG